MKTGLGLYRKYRMLYAYLNLLRFSIRKYLIGFDVANLFIQRVDKRSLKMILKKNGATIGENCDIETGLIFHNCKNYTNLMIGNNCHIGKACFFDLRGKITIHNNVVISMKTTIITHQDLNKSDLSILYPAVHGDVEIASNCYIGTNATILKDVSVSNNSIIAAGAIVSENISAYSIVGGVPAKLINLNHLIFCSSGIFVPSVPP